MKNDGIAYKTDLFRFDKKKGEWTRRRDYDIITSFKFAGNEFFIVYNKGVFFVGIDIDGNLMSVYYLTEIQDGKKVFPGEVASMFRKLYIKNKINQDALNRFLKDPVGYCENKNAG